MRRGFTLLELALVLMILAIIAGAVTLRMAGAKHQVDMGEAAGQIVDLDRRTRQFARLQDTPVWLVLESGEFRAVDKAGKPVWAAMSLPQGFAVSKLIVHGQGTSTGRTAVAYSTQGLTPTFALRLSGPAGQEKWLLIAGLTGQRIELNDETEVRKALDSIR